MTLDFYPVMGVAQAHDAWRKARDMVRAGSDPSRSQEKATDFEGVFEEWMARDQEGRGHRSAGIVRHRIEREVLPQWGNRSIAEIGRRDVLDAIDAVADQGAVISARRLHSHLHRLFRWAVGPASSRQTRWPTCRSLEARRSATAFLAMPSWSRCGRRRRSWAIPTGLPSSFSSLRAGGARR